jgi:Domain of Unknown Function (DUF1080)
MKLRWLLLLGCCLVGSASAEEGFVPMFDGKTLDGWKQVGGAAKYRVDGEEIVGTVDPAMKGNAFLRTEKSYGDFIVKLDLKLDLPGNSGIQFRSHERLEKNGTTRVFGYQAEVDPSSRAWSGGLYDEARRGWLYDLKDHPEAQKAFKVKDWNAYEIECRGPHIKIAINGVPCADYLDTMDLEGFIALQVHVGKEGVIRWKNVRIKDLGRSEWKPLWDGKTLTGWHSTGGGHWSIEDGTIHGTNAGPNATHGQLFSDKEYGDFAIRLKFQSKVGNGGLFFRAQEAGLFGVPGYVAQIDPSNHVGSLLQNGGPGDWTEIRPPPEIVAKALKKGDWNEFSVIALGDRLVVHLNGIKTAEVVHPQARKRGRFGLLFLDHPPDVDVRFKDVEILEIGNAGVTRQ